MPIVILILCVKYYDVLLYIFIYFKACFGYRILLFITGIWDIEIWDTGYLKGVLRIWKYRVTGIWDIFAKTFWDMGYWYPVPPKQAPIFYFFRSFETT